jgi:hypothetical protein
MPNFLPLLRTGKLLSSAVILIFLFALFNQRFRSPLDLSLIILYGYFVVIQFTTALTLLLHHVREISPLHVHSLYIALIFAIFFGLLLLILFSAPLVRIVNCCLYDISGFQGVTSDLSFDCSNFKCNEDIISIAIPVLIFGLCSLWTHQQIFNVQQYLAERKREIRDYNSLVQAPVLGVPPHAFSDPYDLDSLS